MRGLDIFLLGLAVVVAFVLLQNAVRNAVIWRATVTPLASIIGSGFLVMAPLLGTIAGSLSVWAMTVVAMIAYWIGAAIRFNIAFENSEPLPAISSTKFDLERASSVALAAAYAISIAFYLRLLAAFVLRGVDGHSEADADALATAILVFIGAYGWRRGLRGLERLEEYSVTLKLAVIVALLVGLSQYDFIHGYDLSELSWDGRTAWERLRVLAGILLVVQGFETSKYLG
jgi:hypothetical protein